MDYYKLETIEFPDSVEEFGNNIISKSQITEIHIPFHLTTFHHRGPLEFNNKLEKYSIDENQANFQVKDGILYSKDMTKLVNVPPNYQSKILTIPYGVTSILPGATGCLQNVEHLYIPQTVQSITGLLYEPKSIKSITIYRKENSTKEIAWYDPYGFGFYNSAVQKKDIIYTNSSLYATYYKENRTVVISSTNESNRYEYQDEILKMNTNINTIIYPKSGSKISSSSFKPLSHNQFTVDDFTNYTTISIYNFKYTFLCHQYFSLHAPLLIFYVIL
ncbi:hypothetical protein TVAG_543700 [Trichomonas vaginalis G3]|uniref:Uncharacterized protein n=1 Tax=Trichomonas vaginalis (strain ATCC PRA-98 / G3) TaxID=412133 RepID=A2HB54_TRIV3|nr:ribonuclease inhibitor domain-containing protein [Trichomonas vaginalis G3]EAX73363.1 hypothetical protein TVAG_543700 [Trichomonas vaginalis G3]KAI5533525.1 ribonuclease inhibitor domain-containing protein [Trichomonas vaginalis G3]|eukprot:XP_001286293.1 hypothetical protein [Trichomonas vaginalis G3]